MAKLLRQLALLNLAAAVAFLLPVIFWHVAENLARGTLAFKLDPGETAEQALAKIQAATDIETLRYRAALLTKMRESDKRTRQADADFMARTLEWILALISIASRSEEHTSELQSRLHLVCRLLLEKKKKKKKHTSRRQLS